jgi:hypothetical protein
MCAAVAMANAGAAGNRYTPRFARGEREEGDDEPDPPTDRVAMAELEFNDVEEEPRPGGKLRAGARA